MILALTNKLTKKGNPYYYEMIKTSLDYCKDAEIYAAIQKSSVAASDYREYREVLHEKIKKEKYDKIIVFGWEALKVLIGHKISVTGDSKFVGWEIPDQELETIVYPLYTPTYLFEKNEDVLWDIFVADLKFALRSKTKFKKINPEIEIDLSEEEVIRKLQNLDSVIAYDYETDGLQPYKRNTEQRKHKIYSVSVADKKGTFSFLLSEKIKPFWIQVLKNQKIKKIAHNLKYEEAWNREILDTACARWYWDTMIAAHCLDNRAGITGLKFQTYINFGIAGYDVESKKYFEKESIPDFNNIKEMNIKELLKYNALDSWFTYELYRKQKKIFESGYRIDKVKKKGFDLFMQGQSKVFPTMERNGMRCDLEILKTELEKLKIKTKETDSKIHKLKIVKKYENQEGHKFNPRSSKQKREILFDMLKMPILKKTKKGTPSTDKEVLSDLDTPLANLLSQKNWYEGVKNKLLELERCTYSGYLHPTFNLQAVSSYRISTSSPNLANVPKRDREAKKIIRSCIRPSKGRQILEGDYSGIEVRMAACYTGDQNLIKYVSDPSTDMHRDTAGDLFLKDIQDVNKETERHLAKNRFVFPTFYEDYYKQMAPQIWKRMTIETKNHLKTKGIRTLEQFTRHVKKVENIFWYDRFAEYARWKQNWYNVYCNRGYIIQKTGFICSGYSRRNAVLNYAMQGTAFHCTLWSMIHIQKYLEKNKMKTRLINQIYDAIVFDAVPEEVEQIKKDCTKIMTEDIKKDFDFLIVPLDVEWEKSEVDGNWGEMKEF